MTEAGWRPDPTGRFEYRYWDGTAWTHNVFRDGNQAEDDASDLTMDIEPLRQPERQDAAPDGQADRVPTSVGAEAGSATTDGLPEPRSDLRAEAFRQASRSCVTWSILLLIVGVGVAALLGNLIGATITSGGVIQLGEVPTKGLDKKFNWLLFFLIAGPALTGSVLLLAAASALKALGYRTEPAAHPN